MYSFTSINQQHRQIFAEKFEYTWKNVYNNIQGK